MFIQDDADNIIVDEDSKGSNSVLTTGNLVDEITAQAEVIAEQTIGKPHSEQVLFELLNKKSLKIYAKGVIRIRKSKKNRQHNGQEKVQTTIYKTYT